MELNGCIMQPAMEAIYLRDGPEKGHKSSSSSFQDALAARRRENCTPSSSMMTPERDLLSSFLQTCAPAGGREGGRERGPDAYGQGKRRI